MTVSGSAASILSAERVALNLAGRMAGIATLTARFVAATGERHRHPHHLHPQDHAGPAHP